MELYHITEKKNVENILREGLIPRIGPRSKGVESKPLICFTEKKYIPAWKILLGIRSPKILKVSINPCITKKTVYTSYEEYFTEQTIEPTCIQLVDMPINRLARKNAMKQLCYDRIDALSALCQECAIHYTRKTNSHYNKLAQYLKNEYRVLKRLDYSVLSTEEKRKYLKDLGESGEFTFLDTYLDTDKKLYQLSMYEDPYSYDIRRNFENLIVEKFSDCLDLNTGGWTGG